MKSYNGFPPEQRWKALRWLRAQQEQGLRSRASCCDVCGQTEGLLQEHSEDYSSPFGNHIGAYSLCYRCHMVIHCRFRNPKGFSAYRTAINEGKRFTALHTNNFFAVLDQLKGKDVPYDLVEPPEATLLDNLRH